jgi:hypothetical protein
VEYHKTNLLNFIIDKDLPINWNNFTYSGTHPKCLSICSFSQLFDATCITVLKTGNQDSSLGYVRSRSKCTNTKPGTLNFTGENKMG